MASPRAITTSRRSAIESVPSLLFGSIRAPSRSSTAADFRRSARRFTNAPASFGYPSPSSMFSATVRLGTSVSSWWTKARPTSCGVERAAESHRLAVDDDLALVRLDDACEDLDQGALTGSVLPEQPDDRAGHDHAVGMVECDHAGVALDEAAHDDERLLPRADSLGGVGSERGRGEGGRRALGGEVGHPRRAATVLRRTATIRIAPWTRLIR